MTTAELYEYITEGTDEIVNQLHSEWEAHGLDPWQEGPIIIYLYQGEPLRILPSKTYNLLMRYFEKEELYEFCMELKQYEGVVEEGDWESVFLDPDKWEKLK